jgi:hypothetical protein
VIESRDDYTPDDHPEAVTVTYPDGTVIEVDEDNPHTCIDPAAAERRCLACEAQWIALPFPTPTNEETCR